MFCYLCSGVESSHTQCLLTAIFNLKRRQKNWWYFKHISSRWHRFYEAKQAQTCKNKGYRYFIVIQEQERTTQKRTDDEYKKLVRKNRSSTVYNDFSLQNLVTFYHKCFDIFLQKIEIKKWLNSAVKKSPGRKKKTPPRSP